MDANHDYVFGYASKFLINTPAAVAQAVRTRLKLFTGEWFLDDREGLDLGVILGKYTAATRDQEVKQRILTTDGVLSIDSYTSHVDGRAFIVEATITTIYGTATIKEAL